MALNLNNLKTPGVYIDEVSLLPPSVVPVETAIPAFVGYTETGEPGEGEDTKAVKIFSFTDYVDQFGGPQSPSDLGVSISITDIVEDITDDTDTVTGSTLLQRSINGNDGIQPVHNMYFAVKHYFDNGGSDCYIVSVGNYGAVSDTDLIDGINALEEIDEVTLFVVPEASSHANFDGVYAAGLNQCENLKDRFVILDVPQSAGAATSRTAAESDIADFQNNGNIGDYGLYGAAYYPYLETTIDIEFEGDEATIPLTHTRVLADGSASGDPSETLPANLAGITEDLLAKQIANAVKDISIILPPSAAMAGIYARVDDNRGVWKAPANVSVGSVIKPVVNITDAIQENMNIHAAGGKSVNAIRTFTGRGILVWGARTLDGNSNEWRYVSVRRFFNFVEESVKKATYQFVFEPNDANTWNTIRAMIENFLTVQWNLGALQGSKTDDAFFVKVGLGQTMTAQDILEGRLIVEIGMAVVRPAEFIILRFMHKLPEA